MTSSFLVESKKNILCISFKPWRSLRRKSFMVTWKRAPISRGHDFQLHCHGWRTQSGLKQSWRYSVWAYSLKHLWWPKFPWTHLLLLEVIRDFDTITTTM